MKQEKDTSKEIHEKYISKQRALVITFKNGYVEEGFLVGFFHGEPDWNEPYIIRWRFIAIAQMPEKYIPGAEKPEGKIIRQEDIFSVHFK